MLLAPIVWLLTIAIVYFFVAQTWWFPPPINHHARAFDAQFLRTLIVVGILFFVAQFALGWAIFRFRGRGAPARFTRGHHKLETVWTFAVAALFLGLVAMGSKIWADVHYDEAPPDAIAIEVLAKQFAFSFRYPGPDGKFGRTELSRINDANGDPFGLDPHDPAGKDDILSATLKIPAGMWRFLVRGFSASILRSASRLNAIAALRAPTMQTRIPSKCCQRKGMCRPSAIGATQAITAANSANGRAKIVWLKRIISKSWRRIMRALSLPQDLRHPPSVSSENAAPPIGRESAPRQNRSNPALIVRRDTSQGTREALSHRLRTRASCCSIVAAKEAFHAVPGSVCDVLLGVLRPLVE